MEVQSGKNGGEWHPILFQPQTEPNTVMQTKCAVHISPVNIDLLPKGVGVPCTIVVVVVGIVGEVVARRKILEMVVYIICVNMIKDIMNKC